MMSEFKFLFLLNNIGTLSVTEKNQENFTKREKLFKKNLSTFTIFKI